MREIVELLALAITESIRGTRLSLTRRNRRVTAAVLAGGATIAAVNWIAISQPTDVTALGLSSGGGIGVMVAPALGGVVTGAVAGFSRRPLYADAKAGTFAAFVGMGMLMTLTGIARATGELPEGGVGFERFGPLTGIMFVLVIGSANVIVTFPVSFIIMFLSRSIIPNNPHKYGWISDDVDNPGLVYVTPGPSEQRDLRSSSTAYSRFANDPPRFSKVPQRFIDAEPE